MVSDSPCSGSPPQQVVYAIQGVVLHHCNYSNVNRILRLRSNNPLTSNNALVGERDTQVQSPTTPGYLRVPRHLRHVPSTIGSITCGTEGDNHVNCKNFLWITRTSGGND